MSFIIFFSRRKIFKVVIKPVTVNGPPSIRSTSYILVGVTTQSTTKIVSFLGFQLNGKILRSSQTKGPKKKNPKKEI